MADNPRPPDAMPPQPNRMRPMQDVEPSIKGHPMYERIADYLTAALGDNTLVMSDDQDAHMVAYFATAAALDWILDR